jgi:transposase-like protein
MSDSRQQSRGRAGEPRNVPGVLAPRSRHRRSPVAPALRLPRGRFTFPHCPNHQCPFYHPRPDWKIRAYGWYRYRIHPRPLRRFQCLCCRRTFTARTFAATYWLHRWDLFLQVVNLSVAAPGLRQTARALGAAHSTIQRHLARAGRHCLLVHRHLVEGRPVREPIVFDGFESFEYSQFFPCHYHLAVGEKSWFIYHFTDSPLRRKGAMTPEQKQRRIEIENALGRPDPKAVENGIYELLRTVLRTATPKPSMAAAAPLFGAGPLPLPEEPFIFSAALRLLSDKHQAYLRALRRLGHERDLPSFVHQTTPSSAPRTRTNPLFAVNLADLLLRHCGANHRRETIAFNKRLQGGLERMAIFTVWRNAIKPMRERRPGETAAMCAGILKAPLSWREVFSRRKFPRSEDLPGSWWLYYWREVKTAALGERQTRHQLK